MSLLPNGNTHSPFIFFPTCHPVRPSSSFSTHYSGVVTWNKIGTLHNDVNWIFVPFFLSLKNILIKHLTQFSILLIWVKKWTMREVNRLIVLWMFVKYRKKVTRSKVVTDFSLFFSLRCLLAETFIKLSFYWGKVLSLFMASFALFLYGGWRWRGVDVKFLSCFKVDLMGWKNIY